MACALLSFYVFDLIGWWKIFQAALLGSLLFLAVLWAARAAFGLRAARIIGYGLLLLLAAFPVLLMVQCEIEMSVPTRIEGNTAIDNDGAIRSLIFLGGMIFPVVIASSVAVGLSVLLFSRRLRRIAAQRSA